MVAFDLSDMAEGVDGLYNRYNGISSPGTNPLRYGFKLVSPTWGNVAYDGANFVFSIAALNAPVPLKMGIADGLNRPSSMFDVTVPQICNNKLIPFVNQALPHGTNQGILLFGVGTKGVTVINDIRHAGDQKCIGEDSTQLSKLPLWLVELQLGELDAGLLLLLDFAVWPSSLMKTRPWR
ncbi:MULTISPECIES: hypothetical protein [Paraburkholderia]|uniref:hypothetical protein n=1 Tax=Paraburkholderia TaxID=1822464 RepID=UPI0016550768|nr:hypothetical protein [Paraburkholderia podalyriae]